MTAAERFKSIGAAIADAFKKLPYAFYVLVHPIDGFYDLKNDPKRKSVNTAVFLMILLAFSAVFRRQLLGYLYTVRYEQLNLNILLEVSVAVLPYIMWVVANWCFTSLMDGDGKFRDIFVFTAVGTLPITITNFICVPLSQSLPLDSSQIYTFISTLGYVIAYLEIFLGMITTHQYSVKKGIGTAILSILGICVIAFIMVLIFYLCQQLFSFGYQLWTEISFRINE